MAIISANAAKITPDRLDEFFVLGNFFASRLDQLTIFCKAWKTKSNATMQS